jgi:hypothetical protein
MTTINSKMMATSPEVAVKYDLMYYVKSAAAGGICCCLTHGALTPVDVVKTRVQLDPAKVRCRRLSTQDRKKVALLATFRLDALCGATVDVPNYSEYVLSPNHKMF